MGKYFQYNRSASIGKELDEWLDANPDESFSEIAREALTRRKEEKERKG
jgi:hypothetical protein